MLLAFSATLPRRGEGQRLLAVRWFSARPDSQEALMVKMTKLLGGAVLRASQPQGVTGRGCAPEEQVVSHISVLTLQPADQGH